MVETKTPAPARYSGALRLLAIKSAAIKGETILKSRPQKLASPAAVPLIGAGNASGVHPYKTALNIDWKKYSYTYHEIRLLPEGDRPNHTNRKESEGAHET